MIARVPSSTLAGIDAIAGEVEVDVARRGMGELKLVGLADTAVKESVSRIQAALRNSGYRWPGPNVTINLAPADVKKDSSAFDLPIAVAVMIAGGMFESERADGFLLTGELALDGRVRAVRGGLATAMLARRLGKRGVLVPAENAAEAAVVEGVEVIGVNYLTEAVGFLSGELEIDATVVDLGEVFAVASRYDMDFGDVRGQESAKRALLVAAAGHHNILMIEPPGRARAWSTAPLVAFPKLSHEPQQACTTRQRSRGDRVPGQEIRLHRCWRACRRPSSHVRIVWLWQTSGRRRRLARRTIIGFAAERPCASRQWTSRAETTERPGCRTATGC